MTLLTTSAQRQTESATVELPNGATSGWNAFFAFAVVLVAAMQAMLVLESAHPCRISFQKLRILLGLEIVEVLIVTISEMMSFFALRNAFSTRLTWLQWIPPCILALGLVQILFDLYFTLYTAAESRIFWRPFSEVGRRGRRLQIVAEVTPLAFITAFSVLLIGWKQQWWLTAPLVSADIAIRATTQEKALSNAALGFSAGFALMLSTCVAAWFLWSEFDCWMRRPNNFIFVQVRHMFSPNNYFEADPSRGLPNIQLTRTVERLHDDMLFATSNGRSIHPSLSNKERRRLLNRAPLHFGNAILPFDIERVRNDDFHYIHVGFMASDTISLLPLLICVTVAVIRLFRSLDADTFDALNELVDAVVIVSVVEIAIGVKALIWGLNGNAGLHHRDMTEDLQNILSFLGGAEVAELTSLSTHPF